MKHSRHYNRVINRHGARCHYCGTQPGRYVLTLDHVRPQSRGGSHDPRNLVPCCTVCNSIKGARTFEEARPALVQRMLGWPRFNSAQLAWLKEGGFDLSELDTAELQFERDRREWEAPRLSAGTKP